MDKDITDQCEFDYSDGEYLPLLKCACGKKFGYWNFSISIYREDAIMCDCGRRLYFANKITIYEVVN